EDDKVKEYQNGSCLCWGEVKKVVRSGVEVVEWTGVEESGGKAVGGKIW
nr:hypothetical protein [Tanacetum cinerariifolium]